MRPRIIVSCGDVNSIGIECFVKAVSTIAFDADITLACDVATLNNYIDRCGLLAKVDGKRLVVNSNQVFIHDLDTPTRIELGHLSSASGKLAVAALEYAAALVSNRQADAVVTLPISKEACSLAGFAYPGQTEFFGSRWGGSALMILAHESVRVALATVHLPMRMVPSILTPDHISERVLTFDRSLRVDFGITEPRIAVLGLNPHAGESGTIGREESDIILPAIEALNRGKGSSVRVDGPLPADGFFGFGAYKEYDGILAMYHDQGLIPLKLLAEGGGVNFSSGLAHVRTSPDHGTAFSMAGKNTANPASTIEAIRAAIEIVQRKQTTNA